MQKQTIIVAGGSGQRMGAEIPKQFLEIGGLPILMHTVKVFADFDREMKIRLVLPEAQFKSWKALCEEHGFAIPCELIAGGDTRFHSVKNGLAGIEDDVLVAVQDGVRPLVSQETLSRCFDVADETGAVVPVTEVRESIRRIEGEETIALNRSEYLLVQTPGVFHAAKLKAAYEQEFQDYFTDDASVMEAAGYKVSVTQGNVENIKITSPSDLKIAEALLKNS